MRDLSDPDGAVRRGGRVANVELNVFSGRPNPRWPLTAEQEAELVRALFKLPSATHAVSSPKILGYRGIIVSNGEEGGGRKVILVYHESILVQRGDRSQAFTDANRSVENWLLDTARGVSESLIARIRSESQSAEAS
jgi:hypothetical protein